MLPHEQRVVDEKTELDIKLKALGNFLDSEFFYKLKDFDRENLNEQYHLMMEYSNILNLRIIRF